MRPMDHAEAHERLADLVLDRADLEIPGTTEEHDRLRRHLESCETCRADLVAWRKTNRDIEEALATSDGSRARMADILAEPAITPPPSLRAAIASIPRPGPTPASAEPIPARILRSSSGIQLGWRRMAPILAAVAVLVIGVALVREQASSLDAARAETQELTQATTVLGRLLGEPGHHVVSLTAADGTKQGSVAWSDHDIAVLTSALTEPAAGQVYRCWIERDGVRSPVGRMWFAGGLAYWTGSLDDWATISLDAGGRFGVSLEPAAGGVSGQPVLAADLPG